MTTTGDYWVTGDTSSLATSGSCRSVERPRAPPRRVRRFRPPALGTLWAHASLESAPARRILPLAAARSPDENRFPRPPAGPRRRPRTGAEPAGQPTRRQRPVDGSSTARLSLPPSRGATAARQVPEAQGPKGGAGLVSHAVAPYPTGSGVLRLTAHPYPVAPDRLFAARRPRRPCAG